MLRVGEKNLEPVVGDLPDAVRVDHDADILEMERVPGRRRSSGSRQPACTRACACWACERSVVSLLPTYP